MNKKTLVPIGALVIVLLVIVVAQVVMAQNNAAPDPRSDPQRLLIPRWFLTSMMLDGQAVELPEKQMNIQFKEDGGANGEGACNGFSTSYQVSPDGKLTFGSIVATEMACEPGMQAEIAYFQALAKVEKFNTENYQLVLSSADGKTSLVFSMPPK